MFETLIGFFVFFGVFSSFGFLHSDLTGAAIDFKMENSALCDQECCPAWYSAFPTIADGSNKNETLAAMAEQAMCGYSSCHMNNERLHFFCDLMKKNSYWAEHGLEYISKGISFTSFRHDVFKQAQSAFLFAIAISQIGNALCLKSHIQSIFECGVKNKYLVYSIISEVVLMVLICYAPGIQDVFGTTAFNGRWIGAAIVIIPIMLAFEETRKWFARQYPAKLKRTDASGEIFYDANPHVLSFVAKLTQY